ncbi:MAG: hypothetical protein AAFY58_01950 [Planctomycetota bacterium]
MPAEDHAPDSSPHKVPHSASATSSTPCRTVTLVRGCHQWRFTCDASDTRAMAAAVGRLATDPTSPLDRIDAALVRRQLDQEDTAGATAGLARTADSDRSVTAGTRGLSTNE